MIYIYVYIYIYEAEGKSNDIIRMAIEGLSLKFGSIGKRLSYE